MLLLSLAAPSPAVTAVLHLDHGLRPESGADADFVEAEAKAQGLPCRRESIDLATQWAERGGSLEGLAREARYAFFARAAEELGLSAILLAHHRDDQVETVALELWRGSGPLGVRAMLEGRPLSRDGKVELLRPFLEHSRAELESLAAEKKIAWREDESNRDLGPRRNRLRHLTLPSWRKLEAGADLDARILTLHDRARAADEKTEQLAQEICEPWLLQLIGDADPLLPREVRLDQNTLSKLPRELLRRVIAVVGRALDAGTFDPSGRQMSVLLDQMQAGGVHMPLTPRLVVDLGESGDLFMLARPAKRRLRRATSWREQALEPKSAIHIEETGEHFALLSPEAPTPSGAGWIEQVLPEPEGLVVRRAETGEKFQPFGLEGRKLVADAQAEAKLPAALRPCLGLVAGKAGGEVLWIPNVRPAEALRVEDARAKHWRLLYRRELI